MHTLGFDDSEVSDSEPDENDSDGISPTALESSCTFQMSQTRFLDILQESKFNWFEVIDRVVEENTEANENIIAKYMDSFFPVCMDSDISNEDKAKLEQSYHAFKLDCCRRHLIDREANALNGQIVSDVENEDPDQYLDLHDIVSERARLLVAKKRKERNRRFRYLRMKQLAERNFLSRQVSKKVTGILKECPNIGEEIEKFVQDCSIGADAWRRTGVLTFDGNTRIKSKVTYERIRQHLMELYNRSFCMARLYSYVCQEIKEGCQRRGTEA